MNTPAGTTERQLEIEKLEAEALIEAEFEAFMRDYRGKRAGPKKPKPAQLPPPQPESY